MTSEFKKGEIIWFFNSYIDGVVEILKPFSLEKVIKKYNPCVCMWQNCGCKSDGLKTILLKKNL